MTIFRIIICILSIHFYLIYVDSKLTLYQGIVIAMYGDRSPLNISLNETDKWPRECGYLSNYGLQNIFIIGDKIQSSYNNFYFMKKKIYSGNSKIMFATAEALITAATLIPGNDAKQWKALYETHFIMILRERLSDPTQCKEYNAELAQIFQQGYYADKVNEYNDLLSLLSRKSGIPNLQMTDFLALYDVMVCYKSSGFTLPLWIDTTVWNRIEELHHIYWQAVYQSEKLSRMSALGLLDIIINIFKNSGIDQPVHFFTVSPHQFVGIFRLIAGDAIIKTHVPRPSTIINMKIFDSTKLYEPSVVYVVIYLANTTSDWSNRISIPLLDKLCFYLDEDKPDYSNLCYLNSSITKLQNKYSLQNSYPGQVCTSTDDENKHPTTHNSTDKLVSKYEYSFWRKLIQLLIIVVLCVVVIVINVITCKLKLQNSEANLDNQIAPQQPQYHPIDREIYQHSLTLDKS